MRPFKSTENYLFLLLMQQLQNWMRNHTAEGSKRHTTSSRFQKTIDKTFKTEPRTRLKHRSEIYSQLYYSKLRDAVEERLVDEKPEDETAMEKKRRKMAIQREVVSTAFAAETEEVKDEVETLFLAQRAEKDAKLALKQEREGGADEGQLDLEAMVE
jgi:hypothetical protein